MSMEKWRFIYRIQLITALRRHWRNAIRRVTRKIPAQTMYWLALEAVIRVTTGRYGNTVPDDLSVMDMLKRIEQLGKG